MKHGRSSTNFEAPGQLSSTLIERLIICGQGMQRNRWTEKLSIGNGKVMELNLIKHDGALKDLRNLLESSRNTEAPESPSSTLAGRRGWSVFRGQATHELKQSLTSLDI